MTLVEVGRICVKKKGREAGRECVIVDLIDKSYVLVTGPKTITGLKRRRVNVEHLDLTSKVLSISRGASDEEVEKALKSI